MESLKNPATDPSKDAIMKPPRHLTKSPSVKPSTSLAETPPKEQSTDPPFNIRKDPFDLPKFDGYRSMDVPPTLSIQHVDDIDYRASTYPVPQLLIPRVEEYPVEVSRFTYAYLRPGLRSMPAEEADRLQQVMDEFGEFDPEFPPAIFLELVHSGYDAEAVKRIIHWTIWHHFTEDSDIRYTLLPPRVVALFRDIAHQGGSPVQVDCMTSF